VPVAPVGDAAFGALLQLDDAAGPALPDPITAGERAALQSAAAGYWVGESFAGQGVATRALAAVTTFALGPFGLHRVEVNVRPENEASLRVVRHLGFRDEGLRERYLHIEGDWRDHRTFALTRDDTGGMPLLQRWQRPGL
jgi:ribosomal-protein-alanine N-acetyltransferase